MPAVAVTDTNNLFGVYEIADTLAKAGVQPIVGALLSVEFAARAPPPDRHRARSRRICRCWCRTRRAIRISPSCCRAAYLEVEAGRLAACEGRQAVRPCRGPDRADRRAGRADQPAAAGRPARCGGCAAGPAGGGVSATGSMSNCSAMAWRRNAPPRTRCWTWPMPRTLPLVATNDVHFGRANMYEAHDALLCIADGAFVSQDDRRRLTREHRFKTAAEMQAQFADLPEAIENTVEIARRCAFRPMKKGSGVFHRGGGPRFACRTDRAGRHWRDAGRRRLGRPGRFRARAHVGVSRHGKVRAVSAYMWSWRGRRCFVVRHESVIRLWTGNGGGGDGTGVRRASACHLCRLGVLSAPAAPFFCLAYIPCG